MKIGVFDSGKGGEFVAARVSKLLPQHEYMVVNDREHVPCLLLPLPQRVSATASLLKIMLAA